MISPLPVLQRTVSPTEKEVVYFDTVFSDVWRDATRVLRIAQGPIKYNMAVCHQFDVQMMAKYYSHTLIVSSCESRAADQRAVTIQHTERTVAGRQYLLNGGIEFLSLLACGC